MKNFEYLQERVWLDIDVMKKHVDGRAEVFLAPQDLDALPDSLRLHARQLKVKSVSVNGVNATFEQLDFLDEIIDEEYRDLAAFDLFYRGAIVASKEGELIIYIPSSVQLESSDQQDNQEDTRQLEDQEIVEQETAATEWGSEKAPKSTTGFKPLHIIIEYEIQDPTCGLRFVLPDPDYTPNRLPHMYTYWGPFGGLCDGARTWMPCRDTLREFSNFRLELTVPSWCVAVASGELVDQMVDTETEKRTLRFVLPCKTNSANVGFAVGPFAKHTPSDTPRMSHFSLPEGSQDLEFATSKLPSSLHFFEKYLQSTYPYHAYSQVFVEDPPDEIQSFAGLSILDQNLLHSPRIIDRELPSHLAQAKAFVGSWISAAVGIQTTKDAWVLLGLTGHLVNAYVRSMDGEEEHGYRIQLALDALTTMELVVDENASPALLSSEVDVYAEYDPTSLSFLEVKAPLVLHMIEQRVGEKYLRLAIQRVVAGDQGDAEDSGKSETQKDDRPLEEKTLQEEKKDESTENDANAQSRAQKVKASWVAEPLSTLNFLKTVKAVAGASGQDLTKSFLSSWILDAGMPFFTVGYWYNRKQNQAEVVIQQEIPPGGKLYTGPINLTIVEETSEYPYQQRIEHRRHKWDFPCHTKVRKSKRRRQDLDAPDESVQINGRPGMGLNDTPVFWVKLDPGVGWLRHVVLHQPDFNWIEQLLSDKQVGSRVHAARALALFHRPHEKPNVVSCRVLTECMSGLTTHSRRLRAEATMALGVWQSIHAPLTNANTSLPIWKALHNLFRIFKEHFFDTNTDMPLPNYFVPSGGKVVLESLGAQQASISSKQIQVQDYAAGEYEIKKAVPRALALIRAQNGQTPGEVEPFLLQLLRENDNSKNYVEMDDQSQVADDCYYIGTIVIAISTLKLDRSSLVAEDSDVVDEMLRYLHYDQVKPSFRQTTSVCCLEALCNLMIEGRCSLDVVDFFEYARPNHLSIVRKVAIESIIRLFFAEDPKTGAEQDSSQVYGPAAGLMWAIDLIRTENSPGIRLFTVQCCLNCIRGFPPSVATQVLATWEHSYTLLLRTEIQRKEPTTFLLNSPDASKVRDMFHAPDLSVLREDTRAARHLVEKMWKLLNRQTATDQRLRVALVVLYRKVWGDETPLAVGHTVAEKSGNWAGGYENLRIMMEENKARSKSGVTYGRKRAASPSPTRSPTGSPREANTDAALEQFRGKKFKIKMGETLFRSYQMQ